VLWLLRIGEAVRRAIKEVHSKKSAGEKKGRQREGRKSSFCGRGGNDLGGMGTGGRTEDWIQNLRKIYPFRRGRPDL